MSENLTYFVYGIVFNSRFTTDERFLESEEKNKYTVVSFESKYGVQYVVQYDTSIVGVTKSYKDFYDCECQGPQQLKTKPFTTDHPDWDTAIRKYCAANDLKYSTPKWYVVVVDELALAEYEENDLEALDSWRSQAP